MEEIKMNDAETVYPDEQRRPERWADHRVIDDDPEKTKRAMEKLGDNGHRMVLVVRLKEDGNPKRRLGYNEEGRWTFVDNTTYKCIHCGIETGTTPRPNSNCSHAPDE